MHLCPVSLAKPAAGPPPSGFLPLLLPQPVMPMQSVSLISIPGKRQGWGLLPLAAQPAGILGEQPLSSLQLGSALVALSTYCSCHIGCQKKDYGEEEEKRREMSQKDHSRLSASSGNILSSHQRDCLPCSTVAVLPAKTALDAIEHYCCKTQSWTGPWGIS